MKPAFKYSLVVTVALIIGAVIFMNKSSTPKVVDVPMPTGEMKKENLVMPNAEGVVSKNTTPVAKKDLPANPYLTKESMLSLAPTMKEFLLLDMKSIKNSEETKDFYSLLRSPAAIEDAEKILLAVKVENLEESERAHFTAIRFLARALGDLNNKSNKDLNETVKKVILADNLSGDLPVKAKMIFAGDKAELVQAYIAFNPNGHKEIIGLTKNNNIKKIVENAYAYNESMRMGN